ncbi:hypothetical protein CW751_09870 [Brumimicrobium salinarum]|uniref:Uncharacterized protein n=1 Tax=Brumimicrobium salinarum TaxID=2058658 RepID=A0A2I0R1B4_9FLAO|nr:hypothetical protein [Brumimicrobium salinarum]PKR80372.1 hypothetical protein CW751_09870 [Brumimicrobium salinarum]
MKVGDKVKCINNLKGKVNKQNICPNWIEEGRIYTIRKIVRGYVLLEEVHNPLWKTSEKGELLEPGFDQRRFIIYTERTS